MCLAIPGRITTMRDDAGLAMGEVDFGGVRRDVCLQYVADEVSVGAYVIVHVGFAIATLDEEEACRTLDALRELDRLDDLDSMVPRAERPNSAGNGV